MQATSTFSSCNKHIGFFSGSGATSTAASTFAFVVALLTGLIVFHFHYRCWLLQLPHTYHIWHTVLQFGCKNKVVVACCRYNAACSLFFTFTQVVVAVLLLRRAFAFVIPAFSQELTLHDTCSSKCCTCYSELLLLISLGNMSTGSINYFLIELQHVHPRKEQQM